MSKLILLILLHLITVLQGRKTRYTPTPPPGTTAVSTSTKTITEVIQQERCDCNNNPHIVEYKSERKVAEDVYCFLYTIHENDLSGACNDLKPPDHIVLSVNVMDGNCKDITCEQYKKLTNLEYSTCDGGCQISTGNDANTGGRGVIVKFTDENFPKDLDLCMNGIEDIDIGMVYYKKKEWSYAYRCGAEPFPKVKCGNPTATPTTAKPTTTPTTQPTTAEPSRQPTTSPIRDPCDDFTGGSRTADVMLLSDMSLTDGSYNDICDWYWRVDTNTFLNNQLKDPKYDIGGENYNFYGPNKLPIGDTMEVEFDLYVQSECKLDTVNDCVVFRIGKEYDQKYPVIQLGEHRVIKVTVSTTSGEVTVSSNRHAYAVGVTGRVKLTWTQSSITLEYNGTKVIDNVAVDPHQIDGRHYNNDNDNDPATFILPLFAGDASEEVLGDDADAIIKNLCVKTSHFTNWQKDYPTLCHIKQNFIAETMTAIKGHDELDQSDEGEMHVRAGYMEFNGNTADVFTGLDHSFNYYPVSTDDLLEQFYFIQKRECGVGTNDVTDLCSALEKAFAEFENNGNTGPDAFAPEPERERKIVIVSNNKQPNLLCKNGNSICEEYEDKIHGRDSGNDGWEVSVIMVNIDMDGNENTYLPCLTRDEDERILDVNTFGNLDYATTNVKKIGRDHWIDKVQDKICDVRFTAYPTRHPTSPPTPEPTEPPTPEPTEPPTPEPTEPPTPEPTEPPTPEPTEPPTPEPTEPPTPEPTEPPTPEPTEPPTPEPTEPPTPEPTEPPTPEPTEPPTPEPTEPPTPEPTEPPTPEPTEPPTPEPTEPPTPEPTEPPTPEPTEPPTPEPTEPPTPEPTEPPTPEPTEPPTPEPTEPPTPEPTEPPTPEPTEPPTPEPTEPPTPEPTEPPTPEPTEPPTPEPTEPPTPEPTEPPTPEPTEPPTPEPTEPPTPEPTEPPTPEPTEPPTPEPTPPQTTTDPTRDPTRDPTTDPTPIPTTTTTTDPTHDPTRDPTTDPTLKPTESPIMCDCRNGREMDLIFLINTGCIQESECDNVMESIAELESSVKGVWSVPRVALITFDGSDIITRLHLQDDHFNSLNSRQRTIPPPQGSNDFMEGAKVLYDIFRNVNCNGNAGESADIEANTIGAIEAAMAMFKQQEDEYLGTLDPIGDRHGNMEYFTGRDKKVVLVSACKNTHSTVEDVCNAYDESIERIINTDKGDREVEFAVINLGTMDGNMDIPGQMGGTYYDPTCDITDGDIRRGWTFGTAGSHFEELTQPQVEDIKDEICQEPTESPTRNPTSDPIPSPTATTTSDPTRDPTRDPTTDPTPISTTTTTTDPTRDPTRDPTTDPTTTTTRYTPPPVSTTRYTPPPVSTTRTPNGCITGKYIDLLLVVDTSCPMSVSQCTDQQQLVADTFKSIRNTDLRMFDNGIQLFKIRVAYVEMGSGDYYTTQIDFIDPYNKGSESQPRIDNPSEINNNYYNFIINRGNQLCEQNALNNRVGNPSLSRILSEADEHLYPVADSNNIQHDREIIIFSNCAARDPARVCKTYVEAKETRIIKNNELLDGRVPIRGINIQMVNNKVIGQNIMQDEETYMACLVEYDPAKRIFVYDFQQQNDETVIRGIKQSVCQRSPTSAPTSDPTNDPTSFPTVNPTYDSAYRAEGNINNLDNNNKKPIDLIGIKYDKNGVDSENRGRDLYTLYTEYSLWVFAAIVTLFALNVCVCAYCKCMRRTNIKSNGKKYGFIDNKAITIDDDDDTESESELDDDIERLVNDR